VPIVWVGRLCINQGDYVERNRQVLRMIDIYREARKVLVWLGKDDDDAQEGDLDEEGRNTRASARAAFMFVAWAAVFFDSNISYKIQDLLMHDEARSAFVRLVQLMRRIWFERMWVLQ
jgi:Heterokaryon incompatibility protein (HET)